VVLLVAIAIYLVCLPLDAFCVAGKCSDWPGWGILAFGALLVAAADANIVWLANPMLFVAWGTVWSGHRLVALAFGLGATVLALSFLSFRTVVTNEGGIAQPITGYKAGYWLWLACMAVTVVSALMLRPEQARQ
jgi:hypothetical protein